MRERGIEKKKKEEEEKEEEKEGEEIVFITSNLKPTGILKQNSSF